MRRFIVPAALAAILLTAGGHAQSPARASTPTLIRHARLIDGSGAPARTADVRIAGDRIVAVGQLSPAADERVYDAGGLALAPGFIDTHSHHDRGLDTARDAAPMVSQGVTTIVVGQDGGRYASHIRSEDRDFWDAIDELIAIGRQHRMPVHVSHIKLGMHDLWGQAATLIGVPDNARSAA